MTQVRVSVVAGAEAWYKNMLIVSAAPCDKFALSQDRSLPALKKSLSSN